MVLLVADTGALEKVGGNNRWWSWWSGAVHRMIEQVAWLVMDKFLQPPADPLRQRGDPAGL